MFEIAKVREVLQNALRVPDAEHDLDGRISGESALLSFAVDDTGHLIKDSVALSTCGWAVSRTITPGPGSDRWLDGFDDDQKRLLEYIFQIGDGKVTVEAGSAATARRGKGLGLVAGTAARVALDVATGGISALPAVAGLALTPVIGAIGSKVVEKVGDSLAKDATETISKAVKEKISRQEDDDSTSVQAASGDSEEKPPSELSAKVLGVTDLAAITRWVAETMGVEEALQPNSIRVKSRQVKVKDSGSTDEFLNSFFAEDLQRVADAVTTGDVGEVLSSYLRDNIGIDTKRRIDVRTNPGRVLQAVAPRSMPIGRWPEQADRPLALSQQFAINEICKNLKDPAARGLYAVNGPPGTGKTTMLRDLIAAVVVERALRLATLKDPRDAFSKAALEWRTEDSKRTRKFHPLIPELTGFEMVVASANNGAVENITLEVPATKAIHRESFPDADYWSGPATLLADTECWGAIAARLGNRSNRSEFVDRFWRGNQPRGKRKREGDKEIPGLHEILHALEQSKADNEKYRVVPWSTAVEQFEKAVAEVERLAAQRQVIADILERTSGFDLHLQRLRQQADDHRDYIVKLQAYRGDLERHATAMARDRTRAEQEVNDARRSLDSAEARVVQAGIAVRSAERALRDYAQTRPGMLRRIWSRNALSDWEGGAQLLAAQVTAADELAARAEAWRSEQSAELTVRQRALNEAAEKERHAQEQLSRCDRDLESAVRAVGDADRAVAQREAMVQQDSQRLQDARRRWPRTVPGAEWDAAPDDREPMEQREKSSPWMDEEFAEARSRAFLAALELHRAVLTNAPKQLRWSLWAVTDVVKGEAPADLPAATVLTAWQLLFLVVPVVSTTFASLSRMFAALGREALGWVFIDEAGQAAPQSAVGALWRAQRAVVVGDPLQLEPVVTLPWSGQKRLCRQFGVDGQWAPQNASVQTMADRLNIFGTWLPEPDGLGETWVGSPLRVHRRCERLMFDISNEIAYDNMMVYGVSFKTEFTLLTRSTWLDVPAQPSGSKWNRVEGDYARKTLETIRDRIEDQMNAELAKAQLPDWSLTDADREAELERRLREAVFVVSPFRDVVRELQRALGTVLPSNWNRVGTVHTTQGKEADIVLLVLGTASDQRQSRDWAAHPPNLLNVAVTRARRRLVVIGDYENWEKHQNFQVLAERSTRVDAVKVWGVSTR
ncbi:DEAD/DEAH box helicase [Nocardia veterana]|uniref:ATP-binding domain-containing protein n=1 Tax=Nocardia veterana TaxID=132249 RepID=A0A7X6LZR1_9NOCA|nr:DEAD/DEAH box helicase [Nocardia veterana]NKY87624.1 ATP-binding domain-containing protein [Nocardia veterana]